MVQKQTIKVIQIKWKMYLEFLTATIGVRRSTVPTAFSQVDKLDILDNYYLIISILSYSIISISAIYLFTSCNSLKSGRTKFTVISFSNIFSNQS